MIMKRSLIVLSSHHDLHTTIIYQKLKRSKGIGEGAPQDKEKVKGEVKHKCVCVSSLDVKYKNLHIDVEATDGGGTLVNQHAHLLNSNISS